MRVEYLIKCQHDSVFGLDQSCLLTVLWHDRYGDLVGGVLTGYCIMISDGLKELVFLLLFFVFAGSCSKFQKPSSSVYTVRRHKRSGRSSEKWKAIAPGEESSSVRVTQ